VTGRETDRDKRKTGEGNEPERQMSRRGMIQGEERNSYGASYARVCTRVCPCICVCDGELETRATKERWRPIEGCRE